MADPAPKSVPTAKVFPFELISMRDGYQPVKMSPNDRMPPIGDAEHGNRAGAAQRDIQRCAVSRFRDGIWREPDRSFSKW